MKTLLTGEMMLQTMKKQKNNSETLKLKGIQEMMIAVAHKFESIRAILENDKKREHFGFHHKYKKL